jgi:hypothetical protein
LRFVFAHDPAVLVGRSRRAKERAQRVRPLQLADHACNDECQHDNANNADNCGTERPPSHLAVEPLCAPLGPRTRGFASQPARQLVGELACGSMAPRYHHMGVQLAATYPDATGRPRQIVEGGAVMREVF